MQPWRLTRTPAARQCRERESPTAHPHRNSPPREALVLAGRLTASLQPRTRLSLEPGSPVTDTVIHLSVVPRNGRASVIQKGWRRDSLSRKAARHRGPHPRIARIPGSAVRGYPGPDQLAQPSNIADAAQL